MFCKGLVLKCFIINDLVYGVFVVMQLINKVLFDGKCLVAEVIVYNVFEGVCEKSGQDLVVVFKCVLDNVCPVFEVCSRRVGGVMYQVLVDVCPVCVTMFVLCWFVDFVCKCCENMMIECLMNEIFDALNGFGAVVKCCEDMYKMVDLNKVFAYYCWQLLSSLREYRILGEFCGIGCVH